MSSTGGGRKKRSTAGGGGGVAKQGRASPKDPHAGVGPPQKISVDAVEKQHRFSNLETGIVLGVNDTHVRVATEGGTMSVARSIFGYNTYRSPNQTNADGGVVHCSKTRLVETMHEVGHHLFWVAFITSGSAKKKPYYREMFCVMRGKVDTIYGLSEVNEQVPMTATGEVVQPRNAAGDVDMLDGTFDLSKVHHMGYKYRQVNHREVLEIKYNGRHYIRKGYKGRDSLDRCYFPAE